MSISKASKKEVLEIIEDSSLTSTDKLLLLEELGWELDDIAEIVTSIIENSPSLNSRGLSHDSKNHGATHG